MRHIHQRPALVLGLIPILLITAACTSPAPTVTPQPRPTHAVTTTLPPGVHEFVSTMYDFRLILPKGWVGVDATLTWDGGGLQGVDSPAFADFKQRGIDRRFTFGFAPVAMGTTLAAWRARLMRAAPEGCVDVRPATRTTLGGEPALTWKTNCEEVQVVKYAVVHGAHGYVGIFEPSGPRTNAADLVPFDSIRRSFRFTS